MDDQTAQKPGTPEYLCEVLKYYENQVDEEDGGWDRNHPRLLGIMGPGVQAKGWSMEALLVDERLWPLYGRNARECVANFVVHYLRMTDMLDEIAGVGLHAVLLVTEAWALDGRDGIERIPGRAISEHVGAKEVRTVIAVAPDSTVYQVTRVRGRHDPVHTGCWLNHATGVGGAFDGDVHKPAEMVKIAGFMTNCLRIMVNAVNERTGTPTLELMTASDDERGLLDQILAVAAR